MPIISDLKVKLVGNDVHFLAGAGKSRTLQPRGFYDVVAELVGGTDGWWKSRLSTLMAMTQEHRSARPVTAENVTLRRTACEASSGG